MRSGSPRWGYVLERLLRLPDTLSSATPRDSRLVRGPVRVLPDKDGIAFAQTVYASLPDGALQVIASAVLSGDSLGVGNSVATAIGAPTPQASQAPLSPEEFKARVEALYADMREATRRGDFRAFGAAYDALGKLLRMPSR
ncbi:MAG: hypothetical protein U0163_18265 [Gemmatimonadaceae bacterium]